MTLRRISHILCAAAFAGVLSTGALAQDHNAPAAEVAPEDLIGMIIVGNVSVPVARAGRVRHYEYGTVGLAVEDTGKFLDDICENRFELADAFLVYLHANPFSTGGAADGQAALEKLLALTPVRLSAPTSSPGLMLFGAGRPKPRTMPTPLVAAQRMSLAARTNEEYQDPG